MLNSSFNWQKKRTWSDIDNAIFFASVCGDGTLVNKDSIKNLPLFRITSTEFKKRIYHVKTLAYKHPLQKWKGDYVIFERRSDAISVIAIKQLQDIVTNWFLSKVAEDKSGLSVNVITQYITVHQRVQQMPLQLSTFLKKLGLFRLLFITARNFIVRNRPQELDLFDTFYTTDVPPTCFVSVYENGCVSGIAKHSDHVSFCTVVLCLQGSVGQDLILTLEHNEQLEVSLSACDLIVFARIEHFVAFRARTERRITINAFF